MAKKIDVCFVITIIIIWLKVKTKLYIFLKYKLHLDIAMIEQMCRHTNQIFIYLFICFDKQNYSNHNISINLW